MSDLTSEEKREAAKEAIRIADNIKPMLHGLGPYVQGAVLAELVSTWQAGYRPDMRAEVLSHWLKAMALLTEVNSTRLWGESFGDLQ